MKGTLVKDQLQERVTKDAFLVRWFCSLSVQTMCSSQVRDFTWSNVAAGTYSLTASYIDTFGITETSAAVTIMVSPTVHQVIAINADGSATGNFVADMAFSRGHTYADTSTSIVTSGVTNPSPASSLANVPLE